MSAHIHRLTELGIAVNHHGRTEQVHALATQLNEYCQSHPNIWFHEQSAIGFFRTIATVSDLAQPEAFLRNLLFLSNSSRELGLANQQIGNMRLGEKEFGIELQNKVAHPGKEWYSEVSLALLAGNSRLDLASINYVYVPNLRQLQILSIQMPWYADLHDSYWSRAEAALKEGLEELETLSTKSELKVVQGQLEAVVNQFRQGQAAVLSPLEIPRLLASKEHLLCLKINSIVNTISHLATRIQARNDYLVTNSEGIRCLNAPLRWRQQSSSGLNQAPKPHFLSLVLFVMLCKQRIGKDVQITIPLQLTGDTERTQQQKSLLARRFVAETGIGEVDSNSVFVLPSESVITGFRTVVLNDLL